MGSNNSKNSPESLERREKIRNFVKEHLEDGNKKCSKKK
jgi:hypothetical protein